MHFPLPSRKPPTHDTTNAADLKSILTSLLPFLQGFHTNPHPHHDDSTNPNQSDPFFDDGYGSGFTKESPLKVSSPPKLRSSPRCTHCTHIVLVTSPLLSIKGMKIQTHIFEGQPTHLHPLPHEKKTTHPSPTSHARHQ